jgi:hypothetical protein
VYALGRRSLNHSLRPAAAMSSLGPTTEAVPSTEPSRFLSPAEYSRRSGLSPSTVSRYLAAGLLPKVQPGGPRHRVLIPVEALQAPATAGQNLGAASRFEQSDSRPIESPVSTTNASPRRGPTPRWKRQPRTTRRTNAKTPHQ